MDELQKAIILSRSCGKVNKEINVIIILDMILTVGLNDISVVLWLQENTLARCQNPAKEFKCMKFGFCWVMVW